MNFPIGVFVATLGTMNRLRPPAKADQLYRPSHQPRPGLLAAEDQLANLQAVREDTRVFSAYELWDGTHIWIITEADRSVTTILLPEE